MSKNQAKTLHELPLERQLTLVPGDEPARLQIPVQLDQVMFEAQDSPRPRRLSKSLLLVGLLAIGGLAALWSRSRKRSDKVHEPKPARFHDLTRLAGSWYEVARLPGKVDKQAFAMQISFSVRGTQHLELAYSWRSGGFDGPLERQGHSLRIPDPSRPACMKKQIVGDLEIDYWVLEIDRHDEYVVLGTPSRQHLWLLSRSPQIDEKRYAEIMGRMQHQGFEIARMIRVPQPQVLPV